MTTETRYINEIQDDSPIIFLEKATDGKVNLKDISKALDEYKRLYKAGFATPAELLTLSRAYPDNDEYSKALEQMGIGDDDSLVIGGPASIELIDREGHLITTKALDISSNATFPSVAFSKNIIGLSCCISLIYLISVVIRTNLPPI